MRSKYLLFLPLLAVMAGCVSQAAQIQPALDAASEMRRIFDHEQAANRALVARSNPSTETLQAYIAQQEATKTAYVAVYLAHVKHLASMANMSAEATAAILDQITKSVVETFPPPRQ